MMRGYSLEQDLKLLVNNPKYSDIEILCDDKKKLYACRPILAARSEVFDRLLYNGMKESYDKQIYFPEINSLGMEIVLEYTYTGSIKEESLTKDNVVEAFCAADYFQLLDLRDVIIKTVKNTANHTKNYLPELLSKIVEKMPLTEDNDILLNLLVETVTTIPLNTIEFGRLSIAGLQYLLSYTYGKEKEKFFATPEYEVFRYSAILAAKQVSNDACKAVMGRLPTLEQLEQLESSNIITDHQKVVKELEPLVKFIDFRRIESQILVKIIEPLEIISPETILSTYRHKALLLGDSDLNDLVWDVLACGPKLIIEDNGKVVQAPVGCTLQSVRAKMTLMTLLDNKGIFEWDIIIEKTCMYAYVGVCASENFNYESLASQQTSWMLCSSSSLWNSREWIGSYCPKFGDGTIITVHVDTNKRTYAFTINDKKYPEEIFKYNLPSRLYPVVSLNYPGRFRIQPHRQPHKKI